LLSNIRFTILDIRYLNKDVRLYPIPDIAYPIYINEGADTR